MASRTVIAWFESARAHAILRRANAASDSCGPGLAYPPDRFPTGHSWQVLAVRFPPVRSIHVASVLATKT